ncbi:hypothetical protein SAMN05216499_14118 [Actinacidiphila paucisporea]|uniref:Uncharacterized protein n=1 Tax=Actinacidiphila paucisporea TaxID=310782 RepID=A0A1M7QSF1_9ACTN|nr:hypothetical protein SAMN05216499_14118 [Actinacidiphila paucisporea]
MLRGQPRCLLSTFGRRGSWVRRSFGTPRATSTGSPTPHPAVRERDGPRSLRAVPSVCRDLVPAVPFCLPGAGCGGWVTMPIARVSSGSAYWYYLKCVAVGDRGQDRCRGRLPVGQVLAGEWIELGAPLLGLTGTVTEAEMKALFDRACTHIPSCWPPASRLEAPLTRVGRKYIRPAYEADQDQYRGAGGLRAGRRRGHGGVGAAVGGVWALCSIWCRGRRRRCRAGGRSGRGLLGLGGIEAPCRSRSFLRDPQLNSFGNDQ